MRCPTCGKPSDDRLIVDVSGFSLTVDGQIIRVRYMESRIAERLNQHWGRPLSSEVIADVLGSTRNSIQTQIVRLREALQHTRLSIQTPDGWGSGYVFKWVG